ncbi:hypothetical protein BH11ARM2_BH11ARM2_21120 [soil metagenome]
MKDQTNLIISIVCGVLAIGVAIACFATKRDPASPAPATKVVTTPVTLPEATVTYANGLSGKSAGGGGFGGFGGPSGIAGFGGGAGGGKRRPGGASIGG